MLLSIYITPILIPQIPPNLPTNFPDPMSDFISSSTDGMIGFIGGSMTAFVGTTFFIIFLARSFKKRKLKKAEKRRCAFGGMGSFWVGFLALKMM